MVTVNVWGSMKPFTEGRNTVDIEASNIRELLNNLVEAYPGLAPQAKEGIAVSIDGVIYQNSHNKSLPQDSEIYLLPQLKGG